MAYFGESNLYLTLAQYCPTSGIILPMPKMPLGTNVKVSHHKDLLHIDLTLPYSALGHYIIGPDRFACF